MSIRKMKKYENPSEMKGTYQDDYIDYKVGDWLDIERQLEKEYTPEDEDDEINYMAYMGHYDKIFEKILKNCNPSIENCYEVYNVILHNITNYILTDNLFIATSGESMSITFEDIEAAYENKKNKLDTVLNQIIVKLKPEIKKIKKAKNQPLTDLQNYLIREHYLYSDGKRVIRSLNDLACEIVRHTRQAITGQYLHETFLQRKGIKYKLNSCNNARDFANKQNQY